MEPIESPLDVMRRQETAEIDPGWYREVFTRDTTDMPWTEDTGQEVDLVHAILDLNGSERVLDLACGSGRHALELAQRGFDVVGVDLSLPLLELARARAAEDQLGVEFVHSDLREISYDAEFDVVLSLNDGAIGYFETPEEDARTFETVACVLRVGGEHLMQVPNILYARKHFPARTWVDGAKMIELLEFYWDEDNQQLLGATIPIRFGKVLDCVESIRSRQRLYSLDEFDRLLDSVGMQIQGTFDADGASREPTDKGYELFVKSRKG